MSKASAEEREILEQFMLPFLHLKKRHPLLPGKENEEAEALLMGISVEELKKYRLNFDENAKQAALELLKEDEIVDIITNLPLDGTETFAALGDSITEDAQGWFEILRHILTISVEKESFTFINAGVAYNTTTDALRRIDRDVLIQEPDWVFVALGTFDAQRLNIAPDRTLIPLSESWENLETIQNILDETISNPAFWITPAPVLNELLAANPLYEYSIEPSDLAQVQQLVAGKSGVIIDSLGTRMGKEGPEAWNYQSDGLHHSLSGHMNVVRLILKKMLEAEIPKS